MINKSNDVLYYKRSGRTDVENKPVITVGSRGRTRVRGREPRSICHKTGSRIYCTTGEFHQYFVVNVHGK